MPAVRSRSPLPREGRVSTRLHRPRGTSSQETWYRNFSWLAEFGFAIKEHAELSVVYKGPGGRVALTQHPSNREIYMDLQSQRGRHELSIGDLLRLLGDPRWETYRSPIGHGMEAVRSALEAESALLREHGEAFLRGKAGVLLSGLNDARERWVHAWEVEQSLLYARPRAAEAFRRRDYDTVVELFAPLEDHLTPAESKKLQFAKRKL